MENKFNRNDDVYNNRKKEILETMGKVKFFGTVTGGVSIFTFLAFPNWYTMWFFGLLTVLSYDAVKIGNSVQHDADNFVRNSPNKNKDPNDPHGWKIIKPYLTHTLLVQKIYNLYNL